MNIKLWASTRYVGSKASTEIEVDDEDWERMTEEEREDFMVEAFWQSGLVDWGWEEQ